MKIDKRTSLILALFLLMLSFNATVQAQRDYIPSYRVAHDLPYDSRFPRQVVDVFLPDNDSRLTIEGYPILFMIHGGGYVAGSKDIMTPTADYFAAEGYAAVTPNYRLGVHPIPIEDLACALAWTISNADLYNFDLSRLVLLGESAGGNAAALISAHDDLARFTTHCPSHLPDKVTFAAVVPYYMYADMSTCGGACFLLKQATSLYLGEPVMSFTSDEMRNIWGDASPLVWIDGSEPPTLVIHGQQDNIVPITETEHYVEVLSAAGIAVETLYIPNAMHGFVERLTNEPAQIANLAVLQFLNRVLNTDQTSLVVHTP
jgi:acetyl esterase/lipase